MSKTTTVNGDSAQRSISEIASVIASPTSYSISDSVLKFKRYRDININWKKAGVAVLGQIEILKNYFQSLWPGVFSDETLLSECKEKYWKFIPLGENDANVNNFVTTVLKLSDPAAQGKEIFCLCESERTHVFLTKAGLLTRGSIDEGWTIKKLWEELGKLPALQRVLAGYDHAKGCITFSTNPQGIYVSRKLHFHMERYYQVKAKLQFVEELKSRVENGMKFASLIASDEEVRKLFKDKELLELHLLNYSRISSLARDLNQEIKEIASELLLEGYYLHLDEKVAKKTVFGLTDQDVAFEQLYTTVVETTVSPDETVEVDVWDWEESRASGNAYKDRSGRIMQPNGEPISRVHVKKKKKIVIPGKPQTGAVLKHVDLDIDPIHAEIWNQTNADKDVHIVEERDGKFYNQKGERIVDIVEACRSSEELRLRTVVVVKEFDFVNEKEKMPKGATFYFNPLPELVPSQLPVVRFQETLDYMMSWEGLELGRLLTSINLAPGETKEISISNRFSSTNTLSSSSRSFSEITVGSSSEVTSEFERLASVELTKAHEVSTSLSAGANYMGIGASGSTGEKSSESLKNFTKDMSRIANKVANTISKHNSLEIQSSSSLSVQNSMDTASRSTVSNINQGSTLNLYYYQVNNRFATRLAIEDLRILIQSSYELIDGSGLYESFDKGLRLNSLLEGVSFMLSPTVFAYDERTVHERIIDEVSEKFQEYTVQPVATKPIEEKKFLEFSVGVVSLSKGLIDKFKTAGSFETRKEALENILDDVSFDKLFLDEVRIIIDSGCFFVDSLVGYHPATERYSEIMRELETRKTSSSIARQDADNAIVRAKEKLLRKDENFITRIISFSKGGDTSATPPIPATSYSLLSLNSNVEEERWEVYLDGEEVEDCSVTNAGEKGLTIEWKRETPSADGLGKRLMLISGSTVLVEI